jgi:hypothetical protein
MKQFIAQENNMSADDGPIIETIDGNTKLILDKLEDLIEIMHRCFEIKQSTEASIALHDAEQGAKRLDNKF